MPLKKTPLKRSVGLKKAPRTNETAVGVSRYRTKRGRRIKGKKSLSDLNKQLDQVFSEYIRRKYADKEGMVRSYTGNETKHWKQLHCGHYLSRTYKAVRWHEDNARPQSMAENIWKHGNPIEFRINLVAELGEEAVKALEARRNELFKPTRDFYEERISYFQEKLKELSPE